ncbi:CvpA family protein [Pelomicrobium methylotrophicum]|uniref:CvpA family protein n=1 Tax=Pelomicrobium methylotrophicum TaxID=2602750 RepID=A0A5C7EKG6_9PROT|nr:CvpA family protein [Pelomicrobium methylotrophicum]TXF12777.1 CvpA family protein [Pelomicrobium methylotrophicum]
MTAFDYVVLAVIGLSVLVSVMRGAVREVMALGGWVAAFLVANLWAAPLAELLPPAIPGASLKLLVAFLALFVGTLVLAALVTLAVSELVKVAGLSLLDRSMGAVFGLARGVLIVLVGVLLAGLTSVPREPFWREATLSAPLEALATSVKGWLPQQVSQRIRFRDGEPVRSG